MDKNSQEFKNLIYDLANGSLDLEHFPVAESKYVENEYEEGKLCNRLYSEMRDAYDRICVRLGKPDQEDRDVEIIIHFDVAQKNTIMWKDENDIIEKLANRIKATID